MPINDPTRSNKIAPASLAFEREERGARTSTTYQESGGAGLTLNLNVTTTTITDGGVIRLVADSMNAVQNAEKRSKLSVGTYHKQFLWSIADDASLYIGGVSGIPFHNENIRAYGCRNVPAGGVNGSDMWGWICSPEQEGIWWLYAFVKVQFTEAMAISRAKLGFYVNGDLITTTDDLWVSDAGELPILNAKLKGGVYSAFTIGDLFSVRLITTSGAASGLDTFLYPTSIEGYVCGHRVQCNNDWQVDLPEANNGFTPAT